MAFDRLIAGAAAAALLAGTASAQTSGGSASTPSTQSGAMQSGGASQPYAAPPVTGGAAQPSAAGGGSSATAQPGAGATGMTPGTTSPGAMGPGAMGPGAMGPGTSATAGAGFRPVQPVAGGNIVATLKASGEFTKLVAALDATNLTSLVSTHPNLTLFAPTDTAFAALPPGQLDTLMKSPTQLQALLTYHLVATSIKESDVKGHSAGKVPAADNKQVTIDGSGPTLKVNDATVLQTPVMASNGYIYPIDKVLTPPAA